MSQNTVKKIKEIDQKIYQLKQEHQRLQSLLEKKIIETLQKENAFSYDFEALLSGIIYVAQTLKRTDDHGKKICASWKNRKFNIFEKLSMQEVIKKES